MSYQTSSKWSPPFWLIIGARKLKIYPVDSAIHLLNSLRATDYLFNSWGEIGLWSRTLSALTDPAHKVVANLTWYLSHRLKNELPYWLKPASVLAERELRSHVACNFTFCVSQTSVKQMWQGFLVLERHSLDSIRIHLHLHPWLWSRVRLLIQSSIDDCNL